MEVLSTFSSINLAKSDHTWISLGTMVFGTHKTQIIVVISLGIDYFLVVG